MKNLFATAMLAGATAAAKRDWTGVSVADAYAPNVATGGWLAGDREQYTLIDKDDDGNSLVLQMYYKDADSLEEGKVVREFHGNLILTTKTLTSGSDLTWGFMFSPEVDGANYDGVMFHIQNADIAGPGTLVPDVEDTEDTEGETDGETSDEDDANGDDDEENNVPADDDQQDQTPPPTDDTDDQDPPAARRLETYSYDMDWQTAVDLWTDGYLDVIAAGNGAEDLISGVSDGLGQQDWNLTRDKSMVHCSDWQAGTCMFMAHFNRRFTTDDDKDLQFTTAAFGYEMSGFYSINYGGDATVNQDEIMITLGNAVGLTAALCSASAALALLAF